MNYINLIIFSPFMILGYVWFNMKSYFRAGEQLGEVVNE